MPQMVPGEVDVFSGVEHVDGGRVAEYMKVTPIGGKSGFDGGKGAVSGVAQGYTWIPDRMRHCGDGSRRLRHPNHFTIKPCRSPCSRQCASIW